MNFALFALDHAADSVLDSGGPLVPFAVTETRGERAISRFVGDLEEGQHQARQTIRNTGGLDRAAVAWDGYLTVNGERTDAVFVEAFEAGGSESVLLAQRYRSVGRLKKRLERVGNAAIAGNGARLF